MEILYQFVFILTTLTQQLVIVHGAGTYGSYFILGVPRYSSATAEFHLVTMSHETFHVSCVIKKVEPPLYEDKVYPTDLYLTRNRVVVKSLDLSLSENYRSIVFENPKYEYEFAITVLFIDKRTGYWIDSMLALPATCFYTEYFLPWFGNYARQLLVMSASDHYDNRIMLYLYNMITGYFHTYERKEVKEKEFAIFDFGMCSLDSNLKDDGDGGVYLLSYEAFGVIVVTCETNFHFNCEVEKSNFPFIESWYYLDYETPMEFVVFNRNTMAKMELTTIYDELIIAVIWAKHVTVVINGEQTLYLKDSERRKIVLDFDYPLHIKTSGNRVLCYYIGRGKDCTSSMALAWLVPVDLFYFSYALSVPFPSNSSLGPMRIFLIMIAEKDTYPDILVDDMRTLSYKAMVSDVSRTMYQVRYLQISPGWHSAYSTKHDNFGLYLYGWKDGGTFLHTVGYVVKHECKVNHLAMDRIPMKPGDRRDNDCDKLVDEDLPNEDLDGDNKIGEDVSRGKAEDGGWGEWSEFICLECNETFSKRSRLCENPAPQYEGMRCMGYAEESNNEKCRVCRMTPCPVGKYGRYCEIACGHCAGTGTCNLITGRCQPCLNGWTGEKCTAPCPEMTYGHACKHSCLEKCNGRDCIERVQGICPAIYDVGLSAVVYYIFLVLLLGTLYGFCMSRVRLEKKPDVVVTVKRVSSKEYTVTEQIMTDK
ncbi:uncharacterized protein LOC131949060 isoform X1 [Physella acuta]|uniref:uncharacterized protein LOC131949060 isoform X1 n=2 Tax=Physella acuta TaxID=109671 RepID=UPI0027DCEC2F|nr:uncharacterized protein LOC131949060 isoform X1 [Physella acuta]